MNVTTDEILDAIRAAEGLQSVSGTGATGPEIAIALGVSALTARRKIKKLLAEGRMDTVDLHRVRMDGRPTRVIGYRLKS